MKSGFSEISSQLKQEALHSSAAHLQKYFVLENSIIQSLGSFEGIKSEYYCYEPKESVNISKFLSIYSDVTSLFMAPSAKSPYHIHLFTGDNPRNFERKLDIPPPLLGSLLNKGYPTQAGLIYKNDQDTKYIAQKLEPLLDAGRFILRPTRALIVKLPEKEYVVNHQIFFANNDTPDSHWIAKVVNESETYTIYDRTKKLKTDALFELTLPYFDKADTKTITQILEDEKDLISTFRSSFKNLAVRIVDGEDIGDIKNDVIQPQLEEITRKFRVIKRTHRLAVGSSIAGLTLSLISFQVDSFQNFQTLFESMGGPSAFGIIASEIRYQHGIDKLKDNPYFLLWKISKAY